MKKMISWNVNGLRACVGKGFLDYFKEMDADIFCIQESKLQEGQIELDLEGYHQYWNYAKKKGYSGTALFTKEEPVSVAYGIGIEEHDQEGRVITAEFADYYVVTCYTPNSQSELARLSYRMTWEDAFLAYLKGLEQKKPVIFCGDFNVAHEEIDLKNPKSNRGNAGFSGPGTGEADPASGQRFYRCVPGPLPGSGGIQLVELSVQRPQEQRGMADRLFPGLPPTDGKGAGLPHPGRYLRQRPLSGGAGNRPVRQAKAANPKKVPEKPLFKPRNPCGKGENRVQ